MRILEERLGGGGESGGEGGKVVELDPYGSSSYCFKCVWHNQDLNGADISVCGGCGLLVDR